MGKRSLDVLIAACALGVSTPLLLFAAIGIRLTSHGPILYRAQRIGRDRRRPQSRSLGSHLPERRQAGFRGREFTMYKFSTMHVGADAGGAITAKNDSRVFPFGAWLRATKIDELPQLFTVIQGDMALVGPRPEAPEIVRNHYTTDDLMTLQIAPGITSPGTLYYYTHGEAIFPSDAVEETYVKRFLPVKLALDRVYMRHPTALYDVRVILRTVALVIARVVGKKSFPDPPELANADLNAAYRFSGSDSRA